MARSSMSGFWMDPDMMFFGKPVSFLSPSLVFDEKEVLLEAQNSVAIYLRKQPFTTLALTQNDKPI